MWRIRLRSQRGGLRNVGIVRRSIAMSLGAVILLAGVHAVPAHAGPDQLWYLPSGISAPPGGKPSLPGNMASIANMKDGNCVDAQNATAANGTLVQVWPCNQQWNQTWDNTNSWCNYTVFYGFQNFQAVCGQQLWWSLLVYYIGNPFTGEAGQCVDVPGGNDALNAQLQIYTCNGTPAQVWRTGVANWGESPFWIRSNITGQGINRCWTNRGGQGNSIRLWDCAYDF